MSYELVQVRWTRYTQGSKVYKAVARDLVAKRNVTLHPYPTDIWGCFEIDSSDPSRRRLIVKKDFIAYEFDIIAQDYSLLLIELEADSYENVFGMSLDMDVLDDYRREFSEADQGQFISVWGVSAYVSKGEEGLKDGYTEWHLEGILDVEKLPTVLKFT